MVILIEPDQGSPVPGLEIPSQLYWVLDDPAPLAGMKRPLARWPWQDLHDVGFREIVSLEPGGYDPTPLTISFSEQLQDLSGGGQPSNLKKEKALVFEAAEVAIAALQMGRGVLVHCGGGRGRTGTILGCVLRHMGIPAEEAVSYLCRVHKARGKPGWPESPWQANVVRTYPA